MFKNDKESKPSRLNIIKYIATFFIFIFALKILKYILPIIKQNALLKEILGLVFCIVVFTGIYMSIHYLYLKIRK